MGLYGENQGSTWGAWDGPVFTVAKGRGCASNEETAQLTEVINNNHRLSVKEQTLEE